MNGFAVQDSWAKALDQERRRNSNRALRLQTDQASRLAQQGAEALRQRMPEFVDHRGAVCPLAVKAYIDLHLASDRVTPATVRAHRAELLRRHPQYAAACSELAAERNAQGVQLTLGASE